VKPRPPGTLYAVRDVTEQKESVWLVKNDKRDGWVCSIKTATRFRSREDALSSLWACRAKGYPDRYRLVAILPRNSRAEAIRAARIEGMEAVRADLAFSYASAADRVAALIKAARKAQT
jgi:hypothetical protein